MADNEVLISLKLVQKGDSIQIVQKRTKKLGDETQKLDRKRQKLSKTTDAYNRREKGAAGISSNSTKNFSKMAQGIDGGGGFELSHRLNLSINLAYYPVQPKLIL